ncbi:MAG: hypothetical protein GF421_02320 [Candidatus Aminicenantes bacterium]|nr:hypothetical protein [Candidatus Aminicenantes bacterium]
MKLFVTVGAEKRPFNRLIKIVDQYVAAGIFPKKTFIQTGHSFYRPKHCSSCSFLNYNDMENKVADADTVISHAGMGTVILCLRHHKIPILFPRMFSYREHVDDHQLIFAHTMAEKGLALTAQTPEELQKIFLNYTKLSKCMNPKQRRYHKNELLAYLKKTLDLFSKKGIKTHGY